MYAMNGILFTPVTKSFITISRTVSEIVSKNQNGAIMLPSPNTVKKDMPKQCRMMLLVFITNYASTYKRRKSYITC